MDNDFTDQTLSLLKDGSLSQNENTIRSYKNKKFEFGEYCEMIFGNEKKCNLGTFFGYRNENKRLSLPCLCGGCLYGEFSKIFDNYDNDTKKIIIISRIQ